MYLKFAPGPFLAECQDQLHNKTLFFELEVSLFARTEPADPPPTII